MGISIRIALVVALLATARATQASTSRTNGTEDAVVEEAGLLGDLVGLAALYVVAIIDGFVNKMPGINNYGACRTGLKRALLFAWWRRPHSQAVIAPGGAPFG